MHNQMRSLRGGFRDTELAVLCPHAPWCTSLPVNGKYLVTPQDTELAVLYPHAASCTSLPAQW